MLITIITLFPEIFLPILNTSIIKRAQDKKLVKFELINLRHFGKGTHQQVDDRPYGGGVGMILRADVLVKAVKKVINHVSREETRIVLTSASGKLYQQEHANWLTKFKHLIIICGHYEGVDQRFIDKYVDEEISIGNYVLTGGEIPAMVIIDSVVRLIPGVLEKPQAIIDESFSLHAINNKSQILLEYPHYTRPEQFEGIKIPKILLSGNHQQIQEWREKQAFAKTKKIRPDLLKK